jgi:uncharacterized coiled-coil protein SlyX
MSIMSQSDTPELLTQLQAKEDRIVELEQQLAISRNKVTTLKQALAFIGGKLSQLTNRSTTDSRPYLGPHSDARW